MGDYFMRFWQVGLMACLIAAACTQAQAGEVSAEGKWKLLVLAFGEDEFAIVDLSKKDGALTGSVVDAQAFLGGPKLGKVELKDGALQLDLNAKGQTIPFVGALGGDAKDKFLGTIRFRGTPYPARLEKTDADKAKLGDQTLLRSILATRKAESASKRAEELTALIHTHKGSPILSHAYESLLGVAEKAKLSSDDVKKHVHQWLDEARPYGPIWVAACRVKVLNGLQGQAAYAPLVLDLAQESEKSLAADASLETRSEIAKAIATAAADVGKTELAKDARARHEALEGKLDEQYHKEVPPFMPQKFVGRKDDKHNRAALFELFTGAQCPPCVAADVAFDALLKTYKGTELVTLQYHLHIPGPDPLTNEASLARAKFYGVTSTPTPIFNGQKVAQGGGGMDGAEAKYQEYRGVIDGLIEDFAQASIKLEAQQSGDTIAVNALAQSKMEGANLRLRIVLTEESIRYVGSNRLRFHHHVVRAMPGGAEGAAFEKGASSVQVKLSLEEVRKTLNAYLDSFAEEQAFPRPRPPIQLQGLSVVAFVQDDDTKQVLQVVTVPLGSSPK